MNWNTGTTRPDSAAANSPREAALRVVKEILEPLGEYNSTFSATAPSLHNGLLMCRTIGVDPADYKETLDGLMDIINQPYYPEDLRPDNEAVQNLVGAVNGLRDMGPMSKEEAEEYKIAEPKARESSPWARD